MIGFESAVVLVAVLSAATSIIALLAALFKKGRRDKDAVHVTIDGQSFDIENVNPDDIDAVLAAVKKQVSEERGRHRALAEMSN